MGTSWNFKISDGKLSLFRVMLAFLVSYIARSLYWDSANAGSSYWEAFFFDLTGLALQLAVFAGLVAVMILPVAMPWGAIWKRRGQSAKLHSPAMWIGLVCILFFLFILLRIGAGTISQLYMYLFEPDRYAAAVAGLLALPPPSLFPTPSDFDRHIFSIIIITPIFEELIYRGIILNFLLSRHSTITALLMSAVIFAGMHGAGYFSAFLGGLYLGSLYIISGRLDVTIFAHAVGNFVASIVDRIFYGELIIYKMEQWAERPFATSLAVVAGLGFIAFLAFCFQTLRNTATNSAFPMPNATKIA